MKLQYKPLNKDTRSSIYVKRTYQPYVEGHWHFHKEYELIYFIQGHGMRIVGDHISHFQSGELVLVGKWLPHLWRNDTDDQKEEYTDFVVIKFTEDFNGVNLFTLPEFTEIRSLLNRANRGIKFDPKILPKIHSSFLDLSNSNSIEKLLHFLGILKVLSQEEDYRLLSSPNFQLPTQVYGENRLQKVINYISENYAEPISLEQIANIAIMTPPAFCRFFKTRTNKTFSLFLNEVRISKACRLLIDEEYPIKQICYEVGFSSLTNFNRTFKSFKQVSPRMYRNRFRSLAS